MKKCDRCEKFPAIVRIESECFETLQDEKSEQTKSHDFCFFCYKIVMPTIPESDLNDLSHILSVKDRSKYQIHRHSVKISYIVETINQLTIEDVKEWVENYIDDYIIDRISAITNKG